jgi:PAS domain-containing protein
VWIHGARTFPDRPKALGDLDICVILARVPPSERRYSQWRGDPTSRPHRLAQARDAISARQAVELSPSYLLADEIAASEPSFAFTPRLHHVGWPFERTHFLAGQCVFLYGPPPEQLVLAPTWDEIHHALDREVEHLERHVHEGDHTIPYEAAYATLNGCRILYTLKTRSPVISKRSAGTWALDNLPALWHAPILAAGRVYDGEATPEDNRLLAATMPELVATVRAQLPPTELRPPGPPRWAG